MTEMTDRELLIRIDERLRSLEEDFKEMKKEMTYGYARKSDLQPHNDRLNRLEKFYWLIIATGLGGFATGLFALLFRS